MDWRRSPGEFRGLGVYGEGEETGNGPQGSSADWGCTVKVRRLETVPRELCGPRMMLGDGTAETGAGSGRAVCNCI